MYKPNIVGSKIIFDDPGVTTLTNTIVDAVDTSITTAAPSVYTYSATLPEQYNVRNYRSVATDVDLSATNRLALGVFLSSTEADDLNVPVLYSVHGSIEWSNEGAFTGNSWFGFGRAPASAVVQDDAAPANALSSFVILSHRTANSVQSSTQQAHHNSFNDDILVYPGTGYPVCFFVCIENLSAAGLNMDALQCTLCIQKYVKDLPVYRPSR